MTKLKLRRCSYCGYEVRVRVTDDRLRVHNVLYASTYWKPGRCPGSGTEGIPTSDTFFEPDPPATARKRNAG